MDNQAYLDNYVSYDPILMRRCWAAALDYFVYWVLVVLYGYFFGDVKEWGFIDDAFQFTVNFNVVSWVIIWFCYFPLIESRLGYTPGKGLFDLKVVMERKNDFKFEVSLKRHMVDLIDFFMFGLVAILLVKFSADHKRLGDRIAHSRVVMID